jgi:hypothetical protein
MTLIRRKTGLSLTYYLIFFGLNSYGGAHAASFLFGADAGGVNGAIFSQVDRSTATLTEGVFTAYFAAGPVGALLDDRDSQGMGIDTSQHLGVSDGGSVGDVTKFNIIDGTNAVSGQAESVSFSFDRPGVLKSLLLDGVKDETLEFYSLALPNGTVLTIFDSRTEFRLSNQGYHLTDLQVPNPVQAQTEDDDLTDIGFLFQAGEIFTLTYGEGDYDDVSGYRTFPTIPEAPNIPGDGSRFQGVIVGVPEPRSALLAGLLSANVLLRRRRK